MDYETTGKRRFTRLFAEIAWDEGCRTFGGLFGTGGEARENVERGFEVHVAENDPALFDAMREDAERCGYRYFAGNARRVRQRFDCYHADFMGTPNLDSGKTIRHVARHTDKLLAVTVATDHIKNEAMQGEAFIPTFAAWVTYFAEGFTLEYLSFYVRNDKHLKMWTAILSRADGKGEAHRVYPAQVTYSIHERGYWASRPMYAHDLLPHRYAPRNIREKQRDNARYLARRQRNIASCQVCGRRFVRVGGPQVYCSNACRVPARAAQRTAASRRFYQKVRAAVSGTAAEAISSEEAA